MRRRLGLLIGAFLFAAASSAVAQGGRVITGTVTDSTTGAPIPSVLVQVRGSTVEATTRGDGTYQLINVSQSRVQLVFRIIGYKSVTVDVATGQNTVNVGLARDILRIEELVVSGRATAVSRQNLANSVATVSGAEIVEVPAQSIEHALQGKIAGADIQTNSGAPGGGAQIRLRGVTTINAGADPLYVVDGVILSNTAIASNQNAVTRASGGSNSASTQDGQVNRIVDINPNDIESIEVLKGASAAAIYGAKAANGVVLITTKKGSAGATRVNFSQRAGVFDLSNKLGSRTFDNQAEWDAYTGGGFAFTPGGFDNEQELGDRNAISTESVLSVSGGDDNTTFFVSALWKNDEGIMKNSGFEKQSIRMNIDQRFSSRLRGGIGSNLVHSLANRALQNNDNAGVSPFMVFPFTPNQVDLRACSEGDARPSCAGVTAGQYPDNAFERSNPLATVANLKNDEDVWRFIGSGFLELDAIQNDNHRLRFQGRGGVDFFQQQNDLFFPPTLQFENDDGFAGTSLLSNSDNLNVNLTGSGIYTYTPSSGVAQFTTSAGVTYATNELNTSRVQAQGIPPTAGQNLNVATTFTINENRTRREDFGFFFQEEVLTLNDKLLVTAAIRGDQTSANSDGEKVFWYPKAAASYRFPDGFGVVDEIKFRLAYGETGNLPLFGQEFTSLNATNNVEGIPGTIVFGTLAADDIRPERNKEIEGGLDAVLFGGRAQVELTAYQQNTTDVILSRTLASSTGFGLQLFNGGELRSRGFEAALGFVPIEAQSFSWLARATFSLNKTKVLDLPVPRFVPANAGFGVGLGSFRIEEGQSATQIVGNCPNTGVGDCGLDGTGQIGDATPDFRLGLTNDVEFGNFRVFGHLDWQKGGDVTNLTELLYDAGGLSSDFETAGNTRISTFGGDTQVYVQDVSFLKLREVTVSYRLPDSFLGNVWGSIRDARISVSGRNLFRITDYRGLDPEVSNFGNQSVGRNIDVAPFPPNRSFFVSLDLGF